MVLLLKVVILVLSGGPSSAAFLSTTRIHFPAAERYFLLTSLCFIALLRCSPPTVRSACAGWSSATASTSSTAAWAGGAWGAAARRGSRRRGGSTSPTPGWPTRTTGGGISSGGARCVHVRRHTKKLRKRSTQQHQPATSAQKSKDSPCGLEHLVFSGNVSRAFVRSPV